VKVISGLPQLIRYSPGSMALAAMGLLRILYRAIHTPGPDDSVFGLSLALALVITLVAVHLLAANGARKQKAWARVLSRVIAFLLFPAVPIGTGVSIYILTNTRPDRWAARPGDLAGKGSEP
jgi:hypothetical protein